MAATEVAQALILAGGQATRMRPYTDDAPKAMVPVAGAPIIGHQLAWLADHGVKSVTISAGYRHEMISEYLGEGSRFGMEIRYAIESEPLGRGGGLKFAARRLADREAPFFVLNGDVVTDFSLKELAACHEREDAAVTVALSPYRSNWGVADLDDDNRIRGFTQSPELPYWINAGIYVFCPDVVSLLPDKGDHEDSTFPQLAREGRLVGYRLSGYWRGIDTVKDVMEASKEIRAAGKVLPREFHTTDAHA
ncbi:D-glycero-alpha-D-manno-heptose 1-phosphate guanylyltransferase [Streptomyces sp. ADI96-02]|uniref:nucleotidyltransferase family protein n=1 Tax=unclassified Streptomyces TaxID=2593676 RepID=UPI000F55749F|nr:nucleotidyltransferase family protein [Streptomyces sp. ADI96-02]RPK55157.1 D-glycero-alpha-D-manno-heptose 1-phosphate guanylyltransferase [Streptomyces sp. ADI96-02]